MAVAKSLRSYTVRGTRFRDAWQSAKNRMQVSVETFQLLLATWREKAIASDIRLGIEALSFGVSFVTLFMNHYGCLVAIMSTGEVFYAFANPSCN